MDTTIYVYELRIRCYMHTTAKYYKRYNQVNYIYNYDNVYLLDRLMRSLDFILRKSIGFH